MLELTADTFLGPLTIVEDNGAIVQLSWQTTRHDSSSTRAASLLLGRARDQLRSYFEGTREDFDLPLRTHGSSFDRSVWACLTHIPFGTVKTYGEVAVLVGTSPRAIGGACKRNPIVVVIPCHRVVGADGRLTGYSGGRGLSTKEALLRHEGSCFEHFGSPKETFTRKERFGS
ncbi:MAG: methylated-DNA--[protein]-cysteine S-methyltransferase [Rhodospirillales bacterium]|nr:methylated-DNA--[protein]-cysteine S-methyltransferase [Rhodospirillales bacterium]